MEVSARITKLDLVKMQFALFFKTKAYFLYFVLIVFFLLITSLDSIEKSGIMMWILPNLVISVFVLFIMIVASVLMLLLTATSAKGFIGNQTFKITDSGFSEVTEGTETISSWNAIEKIYKTKQYIFVRISAYRFHIIPKRAFQSDEEFEQFATLLMDKSKRI